LIASDFTEQPLVPVCSYESTGYRDAQIPRFGAAATNIHECKVVEVNTSATSSIYATLRNIVPQQYLIGNRFGYVSDCKTTRHKAP
jgi:hypothetical protein